MRALTLGLDPIQWLAGGSVVAVLVLLASWQAASWRVGGIVSIGFVLTAIALHLVGLAVVRAVRPLGRVQWFPLRHAVNGLGRPGHQTRVILLAVGLGVFFILGVRLLADEPDARILRRAAAGRARHVPDRRAAGSGRRRCARCSRR